MKTNQYNEPDVMFLQLHDPDDEGKTELADPKAEGVTWCWEPIHHNDVEYIRKDLYDELKNQITVYQLTIENMKRERDEPMKQEPMAYGIQNSAITGKSQLMMTLHHERCGQYPELMVPLYAQQMIGKDKS